MIHGLHTMTDLYGCQGDAGLLLDRATLENYCVNACKDAGLTPVGSHFHQFTNEDGSQAGVTGTVVLAESHLAIHTWPESGDVTVDVYVCNYSRDNSTRAKAIMKELVARLQPTDMLEHNVMRGEVNRVGARKQQLAA